MRDRDFPPVPLRAQTQARLSQCDVLRRRGSHVWDLHLTDPQKCTGDGLLTPAEW